MTKILKAPFPYFGGKSKVAAEVWRRFGKVKNYVEPFFGSGAVLLGRPDADERRVVETANDANGHVANFFRALQADPDGVAYHASWPVNELDLHARGDWLFRRDGVEEWVEWLRAKPKHYCAKSAGWWVWFVCSWIGNVPEIGSSGKGVKRQRPHLSGGGMGVHRRLPHLWHGHGINRKHLSTLADLTEYMRALADRLRHVRVCCGD